MDLSELQTAYIVKWVTALTARNLIKKFPTVIDQEKKGNMRLIFAPYSIMQLRTSLEVFPP
jgi:hypothetical protein